VALCRDGPDRGFVVAWDGWGSSGTDADATIQAQRYTLDGSSAGEQSQVNTYTTGTQRRPDVAVGLGGRLVVAWHSWEG
jgi:hypothetical protein